MYRYFLSRAISLSLLFFYHNLYVQEIPSSHISACSLRHYAESESCLKMSTEILFRQEIIFHSLTFEIKHDFQAIFCYTHFNQAFKVFECLVEMCKKRYKNCFIYLFRIFKLKKNKKLSDYTIIGLNLCYMRSYIIKVRLFRKLQSRIYDSKRNKIFSDLIVKISLEV